MLANLPMHVFNSSETFVKEMVGFLQFNKDATSDRVKQAGILCYSILLHKTYKNIYKDIPIFLQNQLDYFYERIKCKYIPFLSSFNSFIIIGKVY
jgi:hypothetical protein